MDRLGIALLAIAAVFMAVKQGLSDVPQIGDRLRFLRPRGWWNYLPLIFVFFGVAFWLIGSAQEESTTSPSSSFPSQIAVPNAGPNVLPVSVSRRYVDLKSSAHTDLQEREFLRQYSGRKIGLNLELVSAEAIQEGVRLQFSAGDNPDVFVTFDSSWATHLADVRPGTQVHFVATIVEAFPGRFELVDAEPLSMR